jgi:hypothetical protein
MIAKGARAVEQAGTSTRLRTRTIVVALLAGTAAVLLLFPGSGIDRQPPECYSVFGYVVPCDAWVAWAAGAATAGIVGLAPWALDRRR